jgi:sigma-B regulation protein RsbU (phosphoserine phosphatase)
MLSSGTKAIDGGASPLLAALFAAVIAHGAGVEQADDCTQLVIRYNGGRRTKSFAPTQDGVAEASEWLDGVLEDFSAMALGAKLHVILDEICSNIVRHSGASGFGISVELTGKPAGVRLTFSDDGTAYDPLSHTDPDTTLSAAERPIGGLGILMVKKMANSVSYRRMGDRNVLAVDVLLPR